MIATKIHSQAFYFSQRSSDWKARRRMKSNSCPVIIELFGVPGAGKTTLAAAATKSLRLDPTMDLSVGWNRPSRFQKNALVTRAVSDRDCLVRAAHLAIKAPLTRADSLIRLVRLVAKSHWLRSQSGNLLLQEGPLQNLWSILYSAGRVEPDPEMLSPLVRSIYRQINARIVHIDVDPEIALSRVQSRTHGRSRFDDLATSVLRAQLIETAALPYRIAQAARSAGLHVDTLDGSQPIATLVNQLRSIVARAGVFDRTEERI